VRIHPVGRLVFWLFLAIGAWIIAMGVGHGGRESWRTRQEHQQKTQRELERAASLRSSEEQARWATKTKEWVEGWRKPSPQEQERQEKEHVKALAKDLGTEPCQLLPSLCSATVAYTPGHAIIVSATLNGRTHARLLLDTGATRTLISPGILTAAGVALGREGRPTTIYGVTGNDEALDVRLDSLEIGDARVDRLQVLAYEMSLRESDGLLGRDVLERFTVSMDPARGVVTLSPK
jgi:aspartyl protease